MLNHLCWISKTVKIYSNLQSQFISKCLCRFTEIYVDELKDSDDLKVLVAHYLTHTSASSSQVNNIVEFYLTICKEAQTSLTDGTGSKPIYR